MTSFRFEESELLISPEKLVRILGVRMDALWEAHPNAGNRMWTKEVKQYLYDIGKELQSRRKDIEIDVLCTDTVRNTSEFLLDVVWWYRKGKDHKREFMALASEIEWASWWGPKGVPIGEHISRCVGEDFSKLTVVKCPIKLMVFCTWQTRKSHAPMQDLVLKELDRYLDCYSHHVPGEHYVFMDVASAGQRKNWIRSVDGDGVLSPRSELS